MTLVCITNDVPGMTPCTIRGKHAAHCDGITRRWEVDDSLSLLGPAYWPKDTARIRLVEVVDKVLDDDGVERYVPRACTGCLPAEAKKGLLCWSCATKAESAFNIAHDMVTHLASVDRAQQLDNAGIRGSNVWRLPTPATWRLADEMIVLLGHPEPGFPSTATVWEIDVITERVLDAIDFDVWIATKDGAEAAVRFTRLMQHAMNAHPMSEYEHPVRNVRCPECKQRALLWKPPLAFTPDDDNPDGRVRVLCTSCGHEMAHDAYERIAEVEENVLLQALGKARQVTERRVDEAEPICRPCYEVTFPGVQDDGRLRKRKPIREYCAVCGNATEDGLYIAIPKPVPGRYEGIPYLELRQLAKERGIDHRGKGADIIARLEADDSARESKQEEEHHAG